MPRTSLVIPGVTTSNAVIGVSGVSPVKGIRTVLIFQDWTVLSGVVPSVKTLDTTNAYSGTVAATKFQIEPTMGNFIKTGDATTSGEYFVLTYLERGEVIGQ